MITKCLFPAAGYGTRFLPATKAIPKEMLPILTKPLLQYGVEEALSSGINNMAIVTGRGKRAIEDHFDNSYELESQLIGTNREHYLNEIKEIIDKSAFTYVRQKKMLGLGHAILTGKPLIGSQPFAVILADDLCDCNDQGVIEQMIEIYNQYKCSIVAVHEVPIDQVEKYGIISGDLIEGTNDTFRAKDMIEKPNQNDLNNFFGDKCDANENQNFMAIIGRYILTPDIFDILSDLKSGANGEIQLTDAIKIQANNNKVIAYKFRGNHFDCGSLNGYLDAMNYFAKKSNFNNVS